MILLNDDDLSYAITRFDDRSLRHADTVDRRDADSLARAVCWTAVLDMVRRAELPCPRSSRMVAAGMAGEQSVAALQSLLENCWSAAATLADPGRVG